ncbi:hypothetical protein BH10CHL1_BH10CHL1_32500 [soil metagenome]
MEDPSIKLTFQERAADSPFVELIWRIQSERAPLPQRQSAIGRWWWHVTRVRQT